MFKVNRNDPCPCGSGKKYKKCCMLKERDLSAVRAGNREIVQEAINFITIKHGQALKHWVQSVWYDGIDATQRRGIATAHQSIKNILDTNLLEYLMAEGVFAAPPENDEDEASGDHAMAEKPVMATGPVMKLVLDAVMNLSDSQRDYLQQLRKAHLQLYRVAATEPGSSFTLHPCADKKGQDILIEDQWISRQLDVGDTVGLRLMQIGGAWETSGAVYYIPDAYVADLQEQLGKAKSGDESRTLIRFWLGLVAAHV